MALVAAAILAPVSPATASSTLPADGYVGTDGRGWGHGRGLGQYGARGLADQGKPWTEIVAHYYRNTTIETRGAETIRVLVEDSPDVLMTSKATFSVWWSGGAKIADSTSAEPFLRAAISGSQVVVQKSSSRNGPWTTLATASGPAEFRPGSEPLGLVWASGAVTYYRGTMEARLPGGSNSMLAINDLGLEHYLYGVVPREMPATWAAEAVRAQSVAARTYAVHKKDAARAASKLYDICSTTACQVYSGYATGGTTSEEPRVLEHPSANAAVEATSGKVITHAGKPILAEYSSTTGGYTASGSQPYQEAVPDPTDSISPYHTWSTRIAVPSIQTAWPEIGSLTGIRITKRNGFGQWGGRVSEMIISGTGGSVTVSGGTFRSKMGLRSDWFNVRTYMAQLINHSETVSAPAGSQIPVAVYLKNVGNHEWRVNSSERLAIPSGQDSRFAGPDWITPAKPAAVTKNVPRPTAATVGPGEVAEFRFLLHATNVAPGTYTEMFRPLVEGLTWMNDLRITITVNITTGWREDIGNMLTNGSFEHGWSAWSGYGGITSGDGPATGAVRDGSRSMHLAGGGRKGIVQKLSMAGGPGRRVVIGGWARTVATSAGGGPILINLALYNSDGSVTWNPVEFSRGEHEWQYVERVVQAPKVFTRAELYGVFYNQTGRVYFDGFRIFDTSLANPSFDLGLASWTGSGLASGDGPSSAVVVDGHQSVRFGGGTKSLRQRVPVNGAPGRMFRIAGWTKAEDANASGFTAITVIFNNHDGSQSTYTTAATAGSHEWEFVENHVAALKSFRSIDVIASVSSQSGSIYFDGLRLRENRIPNGSFDNGQAPWEPTGTWVDAVDGVASATVRDATTALKLGPANRKGMRVSLDSGGSAGVQILVSGWNKTATDNPAGSVWLSIGFRNRDGTTTWRNSYFPNPAHDWVHQEMLVSAPKPYDRIDVYAMAQNPTGDVWFDGITLWALY
ncbi:MAG TPA: SpoIID/LytB domain-containing protein [Actinomycetota bacterium]|nr:SpoIID/LytB domain-containing protein [Actinomycetota bacterium]